MDERADDYLVRLDRPDPGAVGSTTPKEPSWQHRRLRRWRRRAMVLTVVLVAILARDRILDVTGSLVDSVVEDVTTVEEGLGGAVDALDRIYEERDTYEATLSELQTFGPKVDWMGEIRPQVCAAGQAVVVVSHGETRYSRLLVQGEDWGQIPGEHGCPRSFANPHPWTVPGESG